MSSCKSGPELLCPDGLWLAGAWRGTQIGTCSRLALFLLLIDMKTEVQDESAQEHGVGKKLVHVYILPFFFPERLIPCCCMG